MLAFELLRVFGKQRASGLLRELQHPETTAGIRSNVVMTCALVEQGNKMSLFFVETQGDFRGIHGQSGSAGTKTQCRQQNDPLWTVPTLIRSVLHSMRFDQVFLVERNTRRYGARSCLACSSMKATFRAMSSCRADVSCSKSMVISPR
jgi:hypothetical protein